MFLKEEEEKSGCQNKQTKQRHFCSYLVCITFGLGFFVVLFVVGWGFYLSSDVCLLVAFGGFCVGVFFNSLKTLC